MKHTKYTCSACGCKTTKARPVKGYTLCKPCNMELINTGELNIGSVTLTNNRKKTYFERQRQVNEHAAQSGWDFVTGNPAY